MEWVEKDNKFTKSGVRVYIQRYGAYVSVGEVKTGEHAGWNISARHAQLCLHSLTDTAAQLEHCHHYQWCVGRSRCMPQEYSTFARI